MSNNCYPRIRSGEVPEGVLKVTKYLKGEFLYIYFLKHAITFYEENSI